MYFLLYFLNEISRVKLRYTLMFVPLYIQIDVLFRLLEDKSLMM